MRSKYFRTSRLRKLVFIIDQLVNIPLNYFMLRGKFVFIEHLLDYMTHTTYLLPINELTYTSSAPQYKMLLQHLIYCGTEGVS
jgi:hypothetical protein